MTPHLPTDWYIMQICQAITNLRNLMCYAEKDFERYKILITYGQIISPNNYCKFAYPKQSVEITMLTEN